MILLFDPSPSSLRCCAVENHDYRESQCAREEDWVDFVSRILGSAQGIDAVGYLMYHGGERIDEPASLLFESNLDSVEQCIEYFPEYNSLTCKLGRHGMRELPQVPHVLLCDTAFFADLPVEASTYALTHELCEGGLRRYGGYGLCHQWAWEQAQCLPGSRKQRVVSVHIGNQPNLAAIREGRPLETSIGFTPVEGIPSSTTCGDVDPTIIFYLRWSGMTFEEINTLLSSESGLTGLMGRPCNVTDILSAPGDPDASAAREILLYSLIKYIGAFTATLGGIDVLVFDTESPEDAADLVGEICRKLSFLGAKLPTTRAGRGIISSDDSAIQVLSLGYNKWEIMAHYVRALLNQQETGR